MTIAAVYARKSTEHGVAIEMTSTARQIEGARAYAATKGWTLPDEFVFEDPKMSGAEFEKRPGLQHLLAMLSPRAPFTKLIVSEQKSVGREMFETGYIIKRLDEAGVEVWGYLEDRCITPRDPLEKMVFTMQGSSDEDHRNKTSLRMHDKHTQLAKMGYVCGGRCYGYRNIDVTSGEDQHGRPLKSHVDRVIEPAERDGVLRIFTLFDSGYGLKAIAKQLNSENVPSPRPFQRKDGSPPLRPGWSASTVRAVLHRDTYRGVVVWNKLKRRDKYGKAAEIPRPEAEWKRAVRKDLQIVPDDLWARVAARRKETEGRAVRFASGRLAGRPPKSGIVNMLAGLATCGVCGGGMVVEAGGTGLRRYCCYTFRFKGKCSNGLRLPTGEAHEAVLDAVEAHALTPEAIEQVILLTERDDAREQQAKLEREDKDIAKRIGRLVDAIAEGGEVPSLVAKVRELEARKKAIKSDMTALRPVPRLAPKIIADRLADWRRLLRQSPTQARAVLQRVIRGRITFIPRADGGFDFSAETRFDKLFIGVVVPPPTFLKATVGDLRGREHIGPEDTNEADYGRLLERAQDTAHEAIKGWRARRDSNPLPLGSKPSALSK